MKRVLLGLFVVCLSALTTIPAYAQSSSSAATSSNSQVANNQGKTGDSTARVPGGGQGGAARQDWGTLMMLISQTVDPDQWRDFGGTGDSTLLPYPNGVWIDAHGQMKRMEHRGGLGANVQSAAANKSWMQASGLRSISLKKLDRATSDLYETGLPASAQMQNLAGISHIQYVLVDQQAQDVILAGPASTDMSILELEDLCLLLNIVNDHTSPLGCSLDPSDKGLAAAAQFLNHPSTINRLSRTPQIVADQLKKQVGPHEVNIFGINPRCSTALALVDADELMKRYGLGLSKGKVSVKTYFDHLNRSKSLKPQSLIRWWFSYTEDPVVANTENVLFEMPKQAAAVLSQEQWIAASGRREATGKIDPAADAFAKEFTDKFLNLAATEPAFARIEGIFEMGLALQVAVEGGQQTSLISWFPNLARQAKHICLHERAPTTVEGVTAYDRLSNGTVVAVISGGVTVDPAATTTAYHPQRTAALNQPEKMNLAAAADKAWWWD